MILSEFWVLVHRHKTPDEWGLHHFLKVDSPSGDGYQGRYVRPFAYSWQARKEGVGPLYRATTVGLFDPPNIKPRLGALHQAVPGLAAMPVPADIQPYVYFQVAPLEWHHDLSRGVQEVVDRLTVLSVREHPAPVSAFTGQASR